VVNNTLNNLADGVKNTDWQDWLIYCLQSVNPAHPVLRLGVQHLVDHHNKVKITEKSGQIWVQLWTE